MSDEHGNEWSLDLIADLAERVADMLGGSEVDEWRDDPVLETLARAAALFQADGRKVPLPVLDVLRRAAEAGRPCSTVLNHGGL